MLKYSSEGLGVQVGLLEHTLNHDVERFFEPILVHGGNKNFTQLADLGQILSGMFAKTKGPSVTVIEDHEKSEHTLRRIGTSTGRKKRGDDGEERLVSKRNCASEENERGINGGLQSKNQKSQSCTHTRCY